MAGPPEPRICTAAGPAAQLCADAPDGRARTAIPHAMKDWKSLIISAPPNGAAAVCASVFRQSRVSEKKRFWRARLYANGSILSAAERPKSQFRRREEKNDV